MPKKYLKRGLGLIGSGIVMGSIPTMGTTGAETMKTAGMTGLGNIASTLPAQGSMIGAGMVMKQTRRLTKFKKKRIL